MANFIVTTLADTLNPNDGLSLREALALANGTPGSDTITFAPGLFGGTLVLTNGPLLITHDGITINGDINGNGHADITIDAAGASQVFNISDGTNAISAALDGLVIENGHVGGSGGGIFVGAADALTLTNSIVTGNSAYRGGGIYGSTNAHITLTNSTVSGNSSKGIYGSGAGIFVYNGTITLTNSTVSGNSAAGEGGGIQGYGSSNHITLLNSTVSGNSATHYSGGGINVGGGALTLTNSTVSGNSAPGGGGIVGYVGAAITLINSTVTGNSAGDGGGIAGFGAAITLANSIVLGNAATHGNDLFAAPALGGFPGSSLVFTGGNIIGSNPENFATTTGMPTVQLNGANQADLEKVFAAVANDPHTGVLSGVLADNGGPVQTVALNTSAANPAHGSGDAALLVEANIGLDLNGDGNLLDTITTDARGLPRIDGAGLDLGAFEIQTAAPVMLDAVPGKQLTTLSGTATPNTSVSILDNGNLVGTAIAGADGEWSLSVNVPGGAKGGVVIHSYTETATDGSGSTGVTLFAQAGNQSLQGGSGNDVLIAAPNDTLAGGGGSNTFVFNPSFGKDTITDFNVSQDVLRFDHTLFANATASQVLMQAHDTNAGAVIVVDANNSVTLTGVTVAQLHSSDFQFF